jgi:poly(A) polymerase Pap1
MGLTGPLASSCGTRIFTSGSYRLGIHKEGSDIDTVCVGPHHVERRHFFNELYQILQSDPRVTHLKVRQNRGAKPRAAHLLTAARRLSPTRLCP